MRQGIQREQVTVNNDLSRTTTKIREVAGGLERISVAILVDGVMRSVEGGESEWIPRPPEELAQLESLIKNAIGFTETRGDSVKIESIRFQNDDFTEAEELLTSLERREIRHSLFKWSLLVLSLMLFLFLVVRPFMSWMTDSWQGVGVSPHGGEESEDLLSKEKNGAGRVLPIRGGEPVDPEKAESELLRDQIIGLLDRDEEKAVGALGMWLTRKE